MKRKRYEKALEKSSKQATNISQVKTQSIIKKASQMVIHNKHIRSIAHDVKQLIDMIKASMSSTSKFKLHINELLIILGALLYLVSPIDMIPDILGAIGFTDDVAVLTIAIKQLSDATHRFNIYQKEINI